MRWTLELFRWWIRRDRDWQVRVAEPTAAELLGTFCRLILSVSSLEDAWKDVTKTRKPLTSKCSPLMSKLTIGSYPMEREAFDEQFAEYRQNLREEVLRFRSFVTVYRRIQERKVDRLGAVNLAPAFFQVVESSLFSGIVIWGHKLFDERGQRGMFDFLKLVENNLAWMTTGELRRRREYPADHWMLKNRSPITIESIEKDREDLRSLEVLKSFRLRRDKFDAHFDREYFFDRERIASDAPIRWGDLDAAGAQIGRFINNYSADFDGVIYDWEPVNIDDLDVLLDRAARARRDQFDPG